MRGKNKKDWLIVLLDDDSLKNIIEKELCEKLKEKISWRYYENKKMLVFENLSEEKITEISHIISSSQGIGIIQIDKEGMF